MNYAKIASVVALLFYMVAVCFLLYAVLTRGASWWWYHIRFWFTFRSWPTSDKRLMELQKNQYVLERLRSDALALHKANELQAQVLDTIKRGRLKYKEAIKQLAHVERVQKRLLDRFDRAQAITKYCGFDVPAHFSDYMLSERMQQAILRGHGNISA
jgi:hypothetical protein